MDSNPKTRNEKKKNQKQKGRPGDKLGSSKHVRASEALRERKGGTATHSVNGNNSQNKKN